MKQEEKSLLSKGKIIDAAMKLFLEKGYENTTMQDIVEASGMSKGAIYHYFKSKQEIVAYLSDYEKEQFTSRLKELVAHPGMTAQQKIRQIVAYLFSNDTLSTLTKEKWAEKVYTHKRKMGRKSSFCAAGHSAKFSECSFRLLRGNFAARYGK